MKEKKKERKEGGREGVWVVFRHQKHGVHVVKIGAEQIMASIGAEPTREKEHIGENRTSIALPSMENEPPPDGAFFSSEQTDRPIHTVNREFQDCRKHGGAVSPAADAKARRENTRVAKQALGAGMAHEDVIGDAAA